MGTGLRGGSIAQGSGDKPVADPDGEGPSANRTRSASGVMVTRVCVVAARAGASSSVERRGNRPLVDGIGQAGVLRGISIQGGARALFARRDTWVSSVIIGARSTAATIMV